MGRKNKSNRIVQQSNKNVNVNRRNLSTVQHELDELIDQLLRISTVPQEQNLQKSFENQQQIDQLLQKIEKLENDKDKKYFDSSVDNRCSAATIDQFVKWCKQHGAQFDSCDIKEFPGYDLGLEAKSNIPESSLLIAIPKKLMMTISDAKNSELNPLLEKDKILQMMPNVALAIFLLLEKFKETSFWKPYIDILPKKYSTVLFYSMNELEELKGSPTLEIALRQIKSISRQYAYFYKLFSTSNEAVSKLFKSRFTFNSYRWAVSTIMTRQNTIPFQDDYHALIPLWDLCNHSNGKITTSYNPELDRSECLAFRNFAKGEQIFIFYGGRSNADFFIHNGFVYEGNENDCYWIRLGISKSDPLQQKRSQLLLKIGLQPCQDFNIKCNPKPIEGQLLAFLRIFNMNEEQLDHWIHSEKSTDLVYFECGLDTTLEKKAWNFLQARLRLLLATYKTSLEEDEKLIADAESKQQQNGSTPSTTSYNRVLAIRMRASEKRILKDALEYVEQITKQ